MGLTVIDAGVMIGLLDVRDGHHGAALEALSSAATRGAAVAMSASAVAELLVVPARKGGGRLHDQMLVDAVLGFCREYPVEIVAVGVEIATQAARLRATHGPGLRLPDALVVATALVREADALVTTDRRWPTAEHLGLAGRLLVLETEGRVGRLEGSVTQGSTVHRTGAYVGVTGVKRHPLQSA